MTTEETEKAPPHGARKDEPQGPRLWLTGATRHAATIACVLLTVGGIAWTLHGIRPRGQIDTTVALRAQGGAVPVYAAPTGGTAFHQLKPGDHVHLSASKPTGTRYPAHIEIDDAERLGWLEEADFDGGDLSRMKSILAQKGF